MLPVVISAAFNYKLYSKFILLELYLKFLNQLFSAPEFLLILIPLIVLLLGGFKKLLTSIFRTLSATETGTLIVKVSIEEVVLQLEAVTPFGSIILHTGVTEVTKPAGAIFDTSKVSPSAILLFKLRIVISKNPCVFTVSEE